jgi:hypothetical protein
MTEHLGWVDRTLFWNQCFILSYNHCLTNHKCQYLSKCSTPSTWEDGRPALEKSWCCSCLIVIRISDVMLCSLRFCLWTLSAFQSLRSDYIIHYCHKYGDHNFGLLWRQASYIDSHKIFGTLKMKGIFYLEHLQFLLTQCSGVHLGQKLLNTNLLLSNFRFFFLRFQANWSNVQWLIFPETKIKWQACINRNST